MCPYIFFWSGVFEGPAPKPFESWKDWREHCIQTGIFKNFIIRADSNDSNGNDGRPMVDQYD